LEAENFEITAVVFGKEPERDLRVSLRNVGDVALKIVEARLNGVSLVQNVTLEPSMRELIKLSEEWSPGKEYNIEIITENGKNVSFKTEAS